MSNSASRIYPCGRFARRDFIHQIGGGFLGLALGGLWAEAGEIQDIGHRCAPCRQGEVRHLPLHVRRRQPHRHLRSQGQQVGRKIDRCDRLRRQPGGDETAGDSLPAHLHALRKIGHSGFGLVSARRRRDRRHRRRALDVVPRGQSFSRGHRNLAPAIAAGSSIIRRLEAGFRTRWAAPTRICRPS